MSGLSVPEQLLSEDVLQLTDNHIHPPVDIILAQEQVEQDVIPYSALGGILLKDHLQ